MFKVANLDYLLDTYRLDGKKCFCQKCGREGFLTRRWVRSSYRPKYYSWLCDSLENAETFLSADPDNKYEEIQVANLRLTASNEVPKIMKLGDYVDEMRVRISGNKLSPDEKDRDAYVVRSAKKYYHYYIGHYNSATYEKQMTEYKRGKRKSRPNGRTWCKLPKGTDPDSLSALISM